jgi:hypothetical protein
MNPPPGFPTEARATGYDIQACQLAIIDCKQELASLQKQLYERREHLSEANDGKLRGCDLIDGDYVLGRNRGPEVKVTKVKGVLVGLVVEREVGWYAVSPIPLRDHYEKIMSDDMYVVTHLHREL